MRRLSICLVETAPAGQQGSMSRYADLLASSLAASDEVNVSRIKLALPQSTLNKIPLRIRMWVHHCAIFVAAPFRLWHQAADIYHIVDGSHAYVARFLAAEKTVMTAHDIIPLLQIKGVLGGGVPGRGSRAVIDAAIKGGSRCRRVVCDSSSTMNDLQQYGGLGAEKMTVIFPALSDDVVRFADRFPSWHQRRYSDAPCIFHLGHNGFYKNRAGVLRVFAQCCHQVPNLKLKLAGPRMDDMLSQLADSLGISDRVECIVNPSDQQVIELYRNSSLLLFPSIYEGFGWPPLEAMAFGCPVVCSSEGSLSEVAGAAALTAPACEEARLAEHCLSILNDDNRAEAMISRGIKHIERFKPQDMARALMAVYRQVAD